ncbi:MAG: hypothetical protein ACLTF5_02055 [Butyricicoccus sp.]
MDGKKFDKNALKTLVIAASLLLNCVLGGASYTYYHHLAEQMNETASLQSQVSHLEGSVSDLQAQADESQPTIDGLKAQVASLTEEKNGLQTQVDTLTSQKADLQKQVDTLKAGASSGSSSGGSSVTVRPSRQLTAARTTRARPFTSRTPAPNITAPAAGI